VDEETTREQRLIWSRAKFCAVFNVAAYISPSWEQVLELSFVAIAEDALPDLKERAGSTRGTSVFPSELPFVSQKRLTGYLRFARQGSIRSTLQAAIARSCLSSRLARKKNNADAFFLVSEEVVEKGIRYRQDVTMLPNREVKAREMVVSFYNRYKIGMREPKESFLRRMRIDPWTSQGPNQFGRRKGFESMRATRPSWCCRNNRPVGNTPAGYVFT
jgi:hypothetical protein